MGAPGLDEHSTAIDGVRVHSFHRRGSLPAVVLLHGAGGNALSWLPLAEAWPDRALILVDLPGHGASETTSDWSLEGVASRVAEAVRAAYPGAHVWGGHSWGGKLAALIAVLYPELVHRLVLVDPSPAARVSFPAEGFIDTVFGDELGPWPALEAACSAVRSLPQYTPWSTAVERAFRHGIRREEDDRWVACIDRAALLAISKAVFTNDCSERFAALECPTLLLAATESMAWQDDANRPAWGRATWVTLPGHHWLHIQDPAQVARHLQKWLV